MLKKNSFIFYLVIFFTAMASLANAGIEQAYSEKSKQSKKNKKTKKLKEYNKKFNDEYTIFGMDYFQLPREKINSRVKFNKKNKKATKKNVPFTVEGESAENNTVDFNILEGLSDKVINSDRYLLGVNDTILLKYWSETEPPTETKLKVDYKGSVNIPITGKVLTVRGMNLQQAERSIKQELSQALNRPEITLTLSEIRSIHVTIMGESYLPGNYDVPSTTTLYNLLYATGGVNINGTLRDIHIKRTGNDTIHFDFYKFLIEGDCSQDIPLNPGDIIYIPPCKNRVLIKGEVVRPGFFELGENNNIKELLWCCRGIKSTANANNIHIESVVPYKERTVKDIDITKDRDYGLYPVYDNDTVEVRSVHKKVMNQVSIEGAVKIPGKYEFTEGITLEDIINRAGGLLEDAYLDRCELIHKNKDGSEALEIVDLRKLLADKGKHKVLNPLDSVLIYKQKDLKWQGERFVKITGAVKKPGTYYRPDNMTLEDLVNRAGGVLPEGYLRNVFLQRYNQDGTFGELVRCNLEQVQKSKGSKHTLLRDRDEVNIQRLDEIQFTPEEEVSIYGAVQKPGSYPCGSIMPLQSLVQLAGGFLPEASDEVEVARSNYYRKLNHTGNTHKIDKYKTIDIINGSVNCYILKGDVVTVSKLNVIQKRPEIVYIEGRVKKPGPYPLKSNYETLSSVIYRAGGLMNDAFLSGARLYRSARPEGEEFKSNVVNKIIDLYKIIQLNEYKRLTAEMQLKFYKITGENSNSGASETKADSLIGKELSMLKKTNKSFNKKEDNSSSYQLNLNNLNLVTPAREFDYGNLHPSPNLNINISGALRNPGSKDDIILKNNDKIIVPEVPSSINIIGSVVVPSTILFKEGYNVEYYVNRSGGCCDDANKGQIVVIRSNGVVDKANFRTKIYLGDTIFVPNLVMPIAIEEKSEKFNKFLDNFTNLAFSFLLVRSIVK